MNIEGLGVQGREWTQHDLGKTWGVQGRGWMFQRTHQGKACKEEDKHNKGVGGGGVVSTCSKRHKTWGRIQGNLKGKWWMSRWTWELNGNQMGDKLSSQWELNKNGTMWWEPKRKETRKRTNPSPLSFAILNNTIKGQIVGTQKRGDKNKNELHSFGFCSFKKHTKKMNPHMNGFCKEDDDH